jgi:hypothetical protein
MKRVISRWTVCPSTRKGPDIRVANLQLLVPSQFAVVFNSSGFCNSPKASEASHEILNSPFSILQWGAGDLRGSPVFYWFWPFYGFFCATFSVLFHYFMAFF